VINLNALLRRRVEYYEYPWAIDFGESAGLNGKYLIQHRSPITVQCENALAVTYEDLMEQQEETLGT